MRDSAFSSSIICESLKPVSLSSPPRKSKSGVPDFCAFSLAKYSFCDLRNWVESFCSSHVGAADVQTCVSSLYGAVAPQIEAVEKEEAKVEKDVVEELDKRAAAAKPAKKLEEVIGDKKDFEERAEKRRRCDGLFEEAIEVARQTEVAVARHIDHIDGELANLSQHLHATGEFENAGAARPGDEVAVRLDDYDKEAWVLGRVVRYRSDEDLSAAVHKSNFGALRLLDGVAVRFFDRSTWPAGPRHRREK